MGSPRIHLGGWLLFLSRGASVARQLLIFFAGLSASFCLTVHGEPLRIVVAGDGRAEYPWNLPNRPCDSGGMNEWVTTAIAKAVANENASILLWTGDIVNVNDTKADTLKDGLEKWRGIMKQLYSAQVKVWPVRGNHEVYRYLQGDPDGEPIPNAAGVWRDVFSGPYALPKNGPKGQEDLSFYSIENSALIIGLDQYGGADRDSLRRKHLVNQKWLDQVLSQNKKPFTFVYGHEAAFMAGRHNDDDTLAADAFARNLFWQSLANAGALYFCGHDHFYDRMCVVRTGSKPGREVFQITAGTAGAPFYTAAQYAGSAVWKLQRAAHFENVYGYVLIEVDGDNATITFKGAPPTAFNQTATVTFAPMDQIVCDREGCRTKFRESP